MLLALPGWGDTAEASQPRSAPSSPFPPYGALNILHRPWMESRHPPQFLFPRKDMSTKKHLVETPQSPVHHHCLLLLLFSSLGHIFKTISINKLLRHTTPKEHLSHRSPPLPIPPPLVPTRHAISQGHILYTPHSPTPQSPLPISAALLRGASRQQVTAAAVHHHPRGVVSHLWLDSCSKGRSSDGVDRHQGM